MLVILFILAIGATAWLTAWQISMRTAREHAAMLNELMPDGPPGYVHDHEEVQAAWGGGVCHWDCWTNPWPPWNSRCTYHCPSGGGGGTVQ